MDRNEMRRIALGWERVADVYTERLFDELDHKPRDRELLGRVSELAAGLDGDVLDLGCGPGHVTAHLARIGTPTVGVDLSPRMVAIARLRNPRLEFEVADMLEMTLPDDSLAGAVSMYSLINIVRQDVPLVLSRLASAIRPGGPLLVAVHQGTGTHHAAEIFDQAVPMAATLFETNELAGLVVDAGFDIEVAESRQPSAHEGPTRRVHVLATAGRRT